MRWTPKGESTRLTRAVGSIEKHTKEKTLQRFETQHRFSGYPLIWINRLYIYTLFNFNYYVK